MSAPECHASNILKLLIFFLSIVRLQQYFVGACQLDFGFLWRACHCAANRYLVAVVGVANAAVVRQLHGQVARQQIAIVWTVHATATRGAYAGRLEYMF